MNSKEIYSIIIPSKVNIPTSQIYFEKIFPIYNLQWEDIYTLPHQVTASFKFASTIFYQMLISHQMLALQKLSKIFFFRSWDIQIFVFPSSPLFPHVSHCFRGWLQINLKVYQIINCLNKNLITHFVWYLEKEKRYDIKTLSIDRVLKKEHFYGKVMQKMCTKIWSQAPF